MSAAAGNAGARAAALAEQIGAEFDRRLDAKLTALGLTGGMPASNSPGLPADMVPGAGARSHPAGRAHRLPRQPLWFGIVIGSVVSGAAAVIVGVGISDWAGTNVGGSENEIYVNVAGDVLAALAVAWAVLLVACVAHARVFYARARDRPGA